MVESSLETDWKPVPVEHGSKGAQEYSSAPFPYRRILYIRYSVVCSERKICIYVYASNDRRNFLILTEITGVAGLSSAEKICYCAEREFPDTARAV
jgi:hypothetical protein